MMTSPAAVALPSTLDQSSRLRAIRNSRGYHYLVSQPGGSVSGAARRSPLILFLHGSAERGTQVEDVARQGLPKFLAGPADLSPAERALGNNVAERFTVIAPQCAPYEVWDEPMLLTLLDDVARDFPVDADRVYLTGMSMGGFGAWMLGMRHPQRFAALVPICGGGRIADVRQAAENQRAALQRLGVWAFHGARDRIVPVEESVRMIDALKHAGARDVNLTVYPEGDHDAWTAGFGHPALYEWLLRHSR
jgi:predicted peptidase